MKRSGFTMIELIFVIVILGILAAVAIPKLAATRDDATVTSTKATIAQAMSAVPAYYTGQRVASFEDAMTFNVGQAGATNIFVYDDATQCSATFTDAGGATIEMDIVQDAATAPTNNCTPGTVADAADDNLSLLITFPAVATVGVADQVRDLFDEQETTIRVPLSGRRVVR